MGFVGFYFREQRWSVQADIVRSALKNSSPRLEEFIKWRLDEQDQVVRPHVVAQRDKLFDIRKKRESSSLRAHWERIKSGHTSGPCEGVRFLVEGDPLAAWKIKRELVGQAHIRSRMTLLGRDYSDMYSPVGARPITQWAENYDLVAATGVFTDDEERLVRSFLMLMGHMYLQTDHMNWKYGSRNANFEADRVDVIGTVGLCFRGNPDANAFVTHAATLMRKSLEVYCTPGSGKWYENPACYYLQALKCRANLAFHLYVHGIGRPPDIPRFKDFLRWGILLLTPPCPHEYDVMRDGAASGDYELAVKVRRIPPIGDHAYLGQWVPDYFALMSKAYREVDPDFANELLWAFQAGGENGGHFGNSPLLFCALDESDLAPVPDGKARRLVSRRLEGFGAVLRGGVGTHQEFYLLLKQGPGGYRYHRTEGSFLLFADGKPLVYDGGEAGETWRHSTLSFYDAHMPLAAGHVERAAFLPGIDFVQGVHPLAIRPGEPVFLSDNCHHALVQEAYKRFKEANPIDSRSIVWVKNEYIIVHDELNIDPDIPSHWHLQVVAQRVNRRRLVRLPIHWSIWNRPASPAARPEIRVGKCRHSSNPRLQSRSR